jgi:hypothetical protein
MFMPVPHDAPPNQAELARITSEFQQHDCAIQFAVSRERQKKVLVA